MDTDSITPMSENEAWAFLAEHTYGRLALTILGQPEIFPVNYAVSGTHVLFRTAEGTKLLGVVMDSKVAFEVDQVHADGATSVVVKGVATRIESQEELEALDLQDLHSWLPTLKYNLVAIKVAEISGRRFRFGPEPDLTPVM
jgi:nitroimidazol reductase NimA-like FMN-containing flavoprotein (pyridoxamine 5'-phosphate oxidase superfamily)